MKQYRSFASKLSSYIVGASSALLLCSLLICAAFALYAINKESTKVATHTLDTTVSEIETVMKEVETSVNNMAWIVKEHLDDPDYMFHITEQLVKNNSHIIGSAIAFEAHFYPEKGEYFAPYSCIDTRTGNVLTFQLGNNSYDYFTMEWYQFPALMKESRWTEPYFDEGGGQQMMTTFSVPLKDDDGNVFAIITSDLSLSDLTDIIEGIRPFENSFTILLGGTGSYLIHPDPETRLNETIFSKAIATGNDVLMEEGKKMLAGERGVVHYKEGKDRYFMVYGPLSNGWPAGIVCSFEDLFSGINKFMLIMALLTVLCVFLLYQIEKIIIKRQSKPITEFTYTAQAIAKGNFNAKIPMVTSKDEFRRLRGSFLYMEESINKYIKELRSSTSENERYESELSIARNIQDDMLSKNFPKREGLDLFASIHPAKEVGGDLYDFITIGDTLYFIVGDVSGKGVPAALYMAITRYAFHFIAKVGRNPGRIAHDINNSFAEGNDSNMFVTLFIGRVNLKTGEMVYCNGGHNPIIIITPDGKAEYVHAKPNLAAGLFEDFPYEEEETLLQKGSRLVLYTDGVTEAEDDAKDQYGEERLLAYCNGLGTGLSSEDFVDGLLGDIKIFTGDKDQNDDITIMSIQID